MTSRQQRYLEGAWVGRRMAHVREVCDRQALVGADSRMRPSTRRMWERPDAESG